MSALEFVLAMALLGAGEATPGGLSLNPVRVALSPAASTGVVAIRNQGGEPMRFQLTVFEWDHGERGESILGATDDIVVSPSLLVLAPGEERNIRVASLKPAGATEKAYRLLIQQLRPSQRDGREEAQLRMLTAVSLPIFVAPPKPLPQTHVETRTLDAHRWSFALRNTGNVHVQAVSMSVTGLDPTGHTVFERQLAGGYVLPQHARVFAIEYQPGECGRARRLRVNVKTSRGITAEDIEVAPGACAD